MKTISNLNTGQATFLSRAANVTDDLVDYALTIHKRNFRDNPNEHILPAIITALATAYAAEVHAAKN